jgi:hypothetical protein
MRTFLAVLCVAGCGPGWREVVGSKAATDLACEKDAIELKSVGFDFARASGCGRQNWYVKGADDQWVSPLERASFEMSCAKADLTPTSISDDTIGVSGCGKRTVYIRVMGRPGESQKWVLNSAETRQRAD